MLRLIAMIATLILGLVLLPNIATRSQKVIAESKRAIRTAAVDDFECNCVLWLRTYRVKTLPRGLDTLAGKKKIINSTEPKVGSVAVMNIFGDVGHVAYVTAVNSDGTITVDEANYKACKITSGRTGKPSDKGFQVLGYYVPSSSDVIPTAKPTLPASKLFDLNGEWIATGYPDVDEIRIRVRQSGDRVEAIKLTSGNSNVPAGAVTWFGTYTSNSFFGKIQAADGGFTNRRLVEIIIRVSDSSHLVVTMISDDPVTGRRFGPLAFEKIK
jgi:CHAP domain-containing protein